ncbi:MAG: hypothetical protein C0519_11810 [Hyphomicrobium sp.]|nr:hypothetical protein [Hyphomicrobium sp.]PPD07246.1 MAG: hypothetical protein CTY28_10770 [Hyphomicrobium sp.]
MADLSEIEMRILSEMEEGYQDFPMLIYKTTERSGNLEEVAAVQDAVRTLIRRGLVVLEMSSLATGGRSVSQDEAERVINEIVTHLTFLPDTKVWADRRSAVGPPYFQIPVPEMELTEAGEKEAERILEERGMWWWHAKRA